MDSLQLPLPRSLNGFGHSRGGAKDSGARLEIIFQSGKSNPGRVPSAVGDSVGGYESASRDRLMYLTACLVGRHVEVHVRNGSIFTGIFSATDAERNFGIVLKKARLIREGTQQGELVSKALPKTLIIPAKELVQVLATDVDITLDGLASEVQLGKPREISIDSSISQSRHAEVEKELTPWVPDEDIPQPPGLENTFDDRSNRNWDQFEANSRLYGVKSTYNEDLYTTKLERGHQTRHMENEALRIADEIECEETQDLHLAEERGHHLNDDIDEEDRYSSVPRGRGVDDCGYKEDEDTVLDAHNSETFGASSASTSNQLTDVPSLDSCGRAVMPSNLSMMDEEPSSQSTDSVEKQSSIEDPSLSLSMDSQSSLVDKTGSRSKGRPSTKSTTAVSQASSKGNNKQSLSEVSEWLASSKAPSELQPLNSREQPGSSTSSKYDHVRAASASRSPGLSPSSSVGSLSSERSTLNPNAKEFTLVQSQTIAKPPSPVPDVSFYHPPGMGPPFPGYPLVMYNPAGVPMQPPQVYFPPNGPHYGQQMPPGQPRPVVYMPYHHHHHPDMQYNYRRRDY